MFRFPRTFIRFALQLFSTCDPPESDQALGKLPHFMRRLATVWAEQEEPIEKPSQRFHTTRGASSEHNVSCGRQNQPIREDSPSTFRWITTDEITTSPDYYGLPPFIARKL